MRARARACDFRVRARARACVHKYFSFLSGAEEAPSAQRVAALSRSENSDSAPLRREWAGNSLDYYLPTDTEGVKKGRDIDSLLSAAPVYLSDWSVDLWPVSIQKKDS